MKIILLESSYYISIINLIVSIITGIVITIYLWKRNNALSKKEKIIKIYFDLTSSISNYYYFHLNRYQNELFKTLFYHIDNFDIDSEIFNNNKINHESILNIKKELRLDFEEYKFYDGKNPRYYMRVFIIHLSRKEYRKLKTELNNLENKLNEFSDFNVHENFKFEDFYNFRQNIKGIYEINVMGLITSREMEDKIIDELTNFRAFNKKQFPKYKTDLIDEKLVNFIMRI